MCLWPINVDQKTTKKIDNSSLYVTYIFVSALLVDAGKAVITLDKFGTE